MTTEPHSRRELPSQISRRSFIANVLSTSALLHLAREAAEPVPGMPLPETGKSRVLMVSTMTGPVRCDSLGTTLMHEHVLSSVGPRPEDQGYVPIPEDKRQESVDFAVSLLNDAARVGINTLVDLLPNRPMDLYQQIAKRTRVKIVPSTGFYRRTKIPQRYAQMEDEHEMYEYMFKEVTQGIGDTKIPAGIIKIASETSPLSDWEKKVFRAAARVQKATGVPIATHDGAEAREQFDLLISSGATPHRLFISHVDMFLHGKRTNREQFREQLAKELASIAKDGGYMEFDTFGQESYTPWQDLVFLWRSVIDAGFINRLFFSMDCNWRWQNGKKIFEGADSPDADPDASRRAYSYMMTDAVPKLLKSGFTEREIHTILVDNPHRFFCAT